MKELKVSIIGSGFIAQTMHIPIWKRMPGVSIKGIYDLNMDLARKVCEKFKLPLYQTMDDLLDDDGDIVDICTPLSTHFKLASESLNRDKHVLIEKPITRTSEQARTLMEASQRKEKIVGVVQHFLYSRGFEKMIQKLEQGDLGDLKHLEITYPIGLGFDSSKWITNPEEGGILFELGIHSVYVILGLMGYPDLIGSTGVYNLHTLNSNILISLKRKNVTATINLSPAKLNSYLVAVVGSKKEIGWDLASDSLIEHRPSPIRGTWTGAGAELTMNRARVGFSGVVNAGMRAIRYLFFKQREFDQYRLFNAFLSKVRDPSIPFKASAQMGYEAVRVLEDVEKILAKRP